MSSKRRRAQLWAIYFLLIALVDSPAFMDGWSGRLGEHLDADQEQVTPQRRDLFLVK